MPTGHNLCGSARALQCHIHKSPAGYLCRKRGSGPAICVQTEEKSKTSIRKRIIIGKVSYPSKHETLFYRNRCLSLMDSMAPPPYRGSNVGRLCGAASTGASGQARNANEKSAMFLVRRVRTAVWWEKTGRVRPSWGSSRQRHSSANCCVVVWRNCFPRSC